MLSDLWLQSFQVHDHLVILFLKVVVRQNFTAGNMWWDKASHFLMKKKQREVKRREEETPKDPLPSSRTYPLSNHHHPKPIQK